MNIIDFLKGRPRKLGIALSGGALHGAAHIGVLQVLEREGIFPVLVTGTSAGAIIGAAYAAGVPAAEMSGIFKKAGWPDLIRLAWRNSLSLFDSQPMEDFIRENIGDHTFDQLKHKFATVATDLMTGKKVVLNSGSVASAVRASAAYPGLFSPIEMDGKLLVDGGVVDNMPVALLRDMGADYVIAVDLSLPTKLERKPSDPIELIMAVINLMQARAALPDPSLINCHIRPKTGNLSAWGFGDATALMECGRTAAEEHLKKLKQDLKIK